MDLHLSSTQIACKAMAMFPEQDWLHALPAEEPLRSAPHLHPVGEVFHFCAALDRAAGPEGVRDHGAPGRVLSGRHDRLEECPGVLDARRGCPCCRACIVCDHLHAACHDVKT